MVHPPFPGVLLLVGKGQIRVSAPLNAGTHTGAADWGSCRPSANMRITVEQNAGTLELISGHQPKGVPVAVLDTVRPSRS
jgi:hypothetical protein